MDELGTEILLSLEILERGVPNPYHYLLAEALRRGCYIFTTNVDNLVEDACREMGLSIGRDYSVCYGRSDDEDFKDYLARIVASETLEPCIFKLHGSIVPEDPGKKYDSIQFALRQVGKGLFEPRKKILDYFHQNLDFWFIGYSCRDDFSVLPAITLSTSGRRTYWCEYDGGPMAVSLFEDGRLQWELEQEENKPLDQERDEGRININHLLSNRGKCYRIKGNLGSLLETSLCADLGITFEVPPHDISLGMLLLNEWAARIPTWRRYLFGARLFEEGLRWDKAIEYCQKALANPLAEQLTVQQRLADVYYKEATPDSSEKAIDLYQQRVNILSAGSIRANLKTNIANVLRRRGVGWLDQAHEKATEALNEFESSMSESKREKNLEYANCLNIYGLSLYGQRKYDEAKVFFTRSIRIKENIGDVNGIGESENAFSLVFTQEGRRLVTGGHKDKAIEKFVQAIDHAKAAVEARRKIGNRRGYAQNCRNLAWPNSELMKISDSQEEIQEYFLKARDGYTAGLSTWLHITPPPPTEIVTFTNILVALYNDYCHLIYDQEARGKWTLESLRACHRLLVELDLTDKARSEIRPPTTHQNLHTIKESLMTLGLSDEAEKAEELISRLGLSS